MEINQPNKVLGQIGPRTDRKEGRKEPTKGRNARGEGPDERNEIPKGCSQWPERVN